MYKYLIMEYVVQKKKTLIDRQKHAFYSKKEI